MTDFHIQTSQLEFRTPSINFAAYLLAHDYKLLRKETDPHDSRRVLFVFRDQPNREKLTNNFLVGQGGAVDIHRLLDAQKRLKQLVFERSV